MAYFIIEIALALFLFSLYVLFFKPLLPLYKLKFQLGSKAQVFFYPIIGDFVNLTKSNEQFNDGLEIFKRRVQGNPQLKIILSNIFNKPLIEFVDPDYFKEVFTNHENYSKMNMLLHEKLTSQGILFSSPQKWRQQRQILGEPFNYQKLMARLPMMNSVIKEQLEVADKTHLYPFMVKITSEIVIRSFLGEGVHGLQLNGQDLIQEIISIVKELGEIQMKSKYAAMKQYFFGMRGFHVLPCAAEKSLNKRIDDLMALIRSIVDKKIAGYQKKENPIFIESLIEAYLKQQNSASQQAIDETVKITIEEICQLFVSIFTAGTDTTGQSTAACLYFLAKYPEQQEELRKEVHEVLKGEKEVRPEHMSGFVKITAFINESLRLKTPVFAPIVRQAKIDHKIKDIEIKKGWYVFACTMATSWQESFFEKPDEFNYQRWLTSHPVKNDNGFTFVPFSAGGRNCIGQHMALIEIKVILALILLNYKVRMDPNTPVHWPQQFTYAMMPDTAIKFEPI